MYKIAKRICVRLNEKDYASLIYQAKQLWKSQNEFIREMIIKNIVGDIRDYNDYLREIISQTRNYINQIAKYKNSKVLFDEIEKIKKLNEELEELYLLLKS